MSNHKKKRNRAPTSISARRRERQERERGRSHTGRVSLVVPTHDALRPDRGNFAFNVEADTDMQIAGNVLFETLKVLGYMGSEQILAGAVASICNTLQPEIRKEIVKHILQGHNLTVSGEVEEAYVCDLCGNKAPSKNMAHVNKERMPCSGELHKRVGFDAKMAPAFESLLNQGQQATAEAAKAGLWTPGQP